MNASPEIMKFVGEIHACATQMLSNAAYIQGELPGLEMPGALRDKVAKLCTNLIGSKHDLIGEAIELEAMLDAAVTPDRINSRVKCIQGWIANDVASIDQCVADVNEAVASGTASFAVAMLIMESAANILNATPAWPANCNPSADDDEIEDGEVVENDDCYGGDRQASNA